MRIRRTRSAIAIAGTAAAGLLLSAAMVGQASAAPSNVCSEPPAVDVSNTLTHTTITISLACEAEAELHRIVTATVAGVEILKVDTHTAVTAGAAHATTITIPKAEVCVEDPGTGDKTCVPPLL